MNKINLSLKILTPQEVKQVDGIEFSNSALVELFIDDKFIGHFKYLDIALIVFSELRRSLSGNGHYLIFTSASGIADDGGWDGVNVLYKDDSVSWSFRVDSTSYKFEFNESQYRNEIIKLEREVVNLSPAIELEPSAIFFPESWI
ncbi:hypothetical protein SCG7109_BN_00040 [Chlamydiales bacterium SCGC AG-110-M15]|nr:hypothetical protein SCG7109_BN_00040 [Chlamydiales bacterium SCGC AG-110-M15]